MLTNLGNFSLPVAVWLAADNYDLIPRPNTISVTGLLKPLKCILLTQKIEQASLGGDMDVMALIPSRMGSAVHSAVEHAWLNNLPQALNDMGVPADFQKKIKVNPKPEEIEPDDYVIYIEQRVEKEFEGYTVSGKFDFVENGRVKDVKTTSVFNWIEGGNDDKYAWQGSLYRLLNPELITDNVMDVEFIFTDYKELSAKTDKDYPARRIMTRTLSLKSLAEAEHFVRNKIRDIKRYQGSTESQMPPCTSKEVWQQPTTWAYYKNILPGGSTDGVRATKVFTNEQVALTHFSSVGNSGSLQKRPGKVKFCTYCSGRPLCQQAERYVQLKLLEI